MTRSDVCWRKSCKRNSAPRPLSRTEPAPALPDIMSGNVPLLIDPDLALLTTANDGTRARALGIASKTRSTLAPEVPTFAEQGLPGFEFNSLYGVWAPKGTPHEICDKIN